MMDIVKVDYILYFYIAILWICLIVGYAIYYEHKNMVNKRKALKSLEDFLNEKNIKEIRDNEN